MYVMDILIANLITTDPLSGAASVKRLTEAQ